MWSFELPVDQRACQDCLVLQVQGCCRAKLCSAGLGSIDVAQVQYITSLYLHGSIRIGSFPTDPYQQCLGDWHFYEEHQGQRKNRWENAFQMYSTPNNARQSAPLDDVNRKATIVMEHLIQASDVSHTMQHWYIYQKWNEWLFAEMIVAYQNGRVDKDPAENWYQGELGFFDNYIIPLAKK
jgi:hypothetical protein